MRHRLVLRAGVDHGAEDAALAAALADLAPPGLLIGHRRIAVGDDAALRPGESGSADARAGTRRASGAARLAARPLLDRLGARDTLVGRAPSGAPRWPPGVVGSLAHDEAVAVAAVAAADRYAAIGIDIEPDDAVPIDLVSLVATARERASWPAALLAGRLLFCLKEAVFKATHPLDGRFLEFHDVTIDLAAGQATVQDRHRLAIAFVSAPRIVALAFMRRAG